MIHVQASLQLFKDTTLTKITVTSHCKTMKNHDTHITNGMMALYINATIPVG
jgi:hypothetical protein